MLAREDGAYLGSQNDLVEMLGVGRVTLQQTARILEQERLLRVKRGVNGGYYGTRPDEVGVEQAVAVYLRANKSGFSEALQIAGALTAEMVRLAAESDNAAAREELAAVAAVLESLEVGDVPARVVELERAFFDAVFKLAANPLGELMMRVTSRMFFGEPNLKVADQAEGTRMWLQTRLNIARAILARDGEYAQILSRRFNRYLAAQMRAISRAQADAAAS